MQPKMRINIHDNLRDQCEKWHEYPANLLQPSAPSFILRDYRDSLTNDEERLFDSSSERLVFLELYDGSESGLFMTFLA